MEVKNSDFLTHILERLAPLGQVTMRAARGGHGFFMRDVLFGLVVYDTLYFKVGKNNTDEYKKAGSSPFMYVGKHKPESLTFWSVPERVIARDDELRQWAQAAIEATGEVRKNA